MNIKIADILYAKRIYVRTLAKSTGGGGHVCHFSGMGAPLIAYGSQTKTDRGIWFVLPNSAKNVIYESLIIF